MLIHLADVVYIKLEGQGQGALQARGEREFPFPAIPGNTSLPFPFPKIGNDFFILVPVPKGWECYFSFPFPFPKFGNAIFPFPFPLPGIDYQSRE